MKKRSEIEEKYKWDLSPLCRNDDEFYKKLQKAKSFLPKLTVFEGKLNKKDDILQFLKLDEELSKALEPAAQYCFLKNSENLAAEKYNEMKEKLYSLETKLSTETSFAMTEFYQLKDEEIDEILKDERFKNYDRMFAQIKKDKIHKLSKEEEKLLAGMDFLDGYSETMEKMSDVDLDFGTVTTKDGETALTQSNYAKFMRSSDRNLREETFRKLNGAFGKFINALASNYISEVKSNCYFARIRKYDGALQSALQNEEISDKVYDKLIEMVTKNLKILFDYFKLKQKELGLDDFYIYDAMASTEKAGDKTYSYDQAMDIIKKALAPLGDEYVSLLERAKEERWIDVFPNKDKHSGAYESGIFGYHPYVLTNFEGDLDSIFTLAHELGHAMHSYYSNLNQVRQKADYPIFLAEIASTTNEILLLNYLLNQAQTLDEKKALYNKLFDEVKSTIFRQTMFAEFEEKVHKMHENEEGLTKDKLCKIYFELNKKYFGHVKLTEETQYEWARIPHFFNAFYVYKYATGMICAICFANKILSNENGAVKQYFSFLSAGSSDEPLNILKRAGCDLNKDETFTDCFSYLKEMLKEWKKLCKN